MTPDMIALVSESAVEMAALPPFWEDLPWRKDRTPYRIFLAEFLLVRTRADVVKRLFEDIFTHFPSVEVLAATPEAEVAAILAPLGLQKRVPYLLRAAEFILTEYNGKLPSDIDNLIRIPGIGLYTSVAITAFAFGGSTVPADVNILRFLSRLTGLAMDHKTKGSKELRSLLRFLSPNNGGPPPEILLDFTRLICCSRKPLCTKCLLKTKCNFALSTLGVSPSENYLGNNVEAN